MLSVLALLLSTSGSSHFPADLQLGLLPPSGYLPGLLGYEGCRWILARQVAYGLAHLDQDLGDLLRARGLDDYHQLELSGFVPDVDYSESMVVALLRTLIPARAACEIFGDPTLLEGYTDEQLVDAGILSCENLLIAGGLSPNTLADFDSVGVTLPTSDQLAQFVESQIS